MPKGKISYIIGGICIAACVVVAGMWFLNRNKVKDDSVTVDIRTDTASAGENEESSWNTDVHGIARADGGYYYLQMKSKECAYIFMMRAYNGPFRCAVRQSVIMTMCSAMHFF